MYVEFAVFLSMWIQMDMIGTVTIPVCSFFWFHCMADYGKMASKCHNFYS